MEMHHFVHLSFLFFFSLVLTPKNRALPIVLLASKLMKALCCVSIYDLPEVAGGGRKKKKRKLEERRTS